MDPGNGLGNGHAHFTADEIADMRASLLAWYDVNQRDLPWRQTHDPYAIWVSEIMLQQTRVAVVQERYRMFMRDFPTVQALAYATESDVLAQWSGLGYYRRARMLHKAAKVVTFEYGGAMPIVAAELRALPGVGAYTSAAIASIAYGEAVAVIDGNVERVIQRLAGWGSDSRGGQSELARLTGKMANMLLDPARPGDFNQSMMELGATICLPRNPRCLVCPVKAPCQTRGEHPVPPRAPMRSEESGYALAIRSGPQNREVLLVQRSADQTVMPDMWELPSLRDLTIPGAELRMVLRHAIMQVNYYVRIRTVFEEDADVLTIPSETRRWVRLHELDALPLTGLARKVLLRARLPEIAVNPALLQSAAD